MEGAVSEDHPSNSATICLTGSEEPSSDVRSTIALEPASPVILRRLERLLQPPEVFSPGLFLMDARRLRQQEITTARQSTRITSGLETDENVKSSVRGDGDHGC
jgi:hypothetical protein